MTTEKPLVCKILSSFLQYPDEELLNSLGALHSLITELPPSRTREILAGFLEYLKGQSLMRLQQEYSRHFDLNPATCLNLTYHRHGDDRERGAALSDLHRAYCRAGYETTAEELPDYLPLMLEFLCICSEDRRTETVKQYQPQVAALADRLEQAATPYARVLAAAAETFRD